MLLYNYYCVLHDFYCKNMLCIVVIVMGYFIVICRMEWAGVLQGKYTIVESESNLTTSLVSAVCVCLSICVCVCMFVYACMCTFVCVMYVWCVCE